MRNNLSKLYKVSSVAAFAWLGALLLTVSAGASPNTLNLRISARAEHMEVLAPYSTYNVTVPESELPKLRENFIVRHLGLSGGTRSVSAGALLSPFARHWLNRPAEKDGPNCFHASLAGIFKNWTTPRFMDEFEHSAHLIRRFRPLVWNGRSGLEFGDVLVFYTPEQGPVHAAVYIGLADGEAVVFQKASYGRHTPYAFMKLADAISLFNSSEGEDISDIQAFRARQAAIDPLTEAVPSIPILAFPEP